jgi:hypothetical protein
MFRKYCKALMFLPIIASCSSSSSVATTTLVPLVETTTTTVDSGFIYSEDLSFIDDFYYYFGIDGSTYVPYDDQYLIDTAHLWCELMDQGMTGQDIVERINEGGTDRNDINIHFAIIKSAVINYCVDNYTVWYN